MNISAKDIYHLLKERDNSDIDNPKLTKALYGINKKHPATYEELLALVNSYNEQGFISGFDTAVSLLLNPKGVK
ncbi:MAG: hypothetical protein LBD23_18175 [Oscillospiraceae bacterium]|jgi:hypothetical protein|nr:hypothetical protein [Oscillospiraceae bacterium]